MVLYPRARFVDSLPYRTSPFDRFSDGDSFLQAPSIPRIPLSEAPRQLRQRGWLRGVYVIFPTLQPAFPQTDRVLLYPIHVQEKEP